MDVMDPKQFTEYGLLGVVLFGVYKIGFWMIQEHMRQMQTYNQTLVAELQKLIVAVEKNTDKVQQVMLALVGTDTVDLRCRFGDNHKLSDSGGFRGTDALPQRVEDISSSQGRDIAPPSSPRI